MEKLPERGKFDPHRTLLVRNFSNDECNVSLYNLFSLFGELEFLYCLDTANGKYPNFAVMQYTSIADAKSALHGVLSQPKNHLVLSQPWVGAFGKKDPYTAQQIIRGIALMNKISVQHQSVIQRHKFSLFEFNRFGVVDHYQVQENTSICEIAYVSPLSATLAVMGISNPMVEVTLIKDFLQESCTGTDGFTLNRCNFIFSVDSMNPLEISDLCKIIKYQLSSEWRIFLNPIKCYANQEWNKPGILRSLSFSSDDNTLSFRIAIKLEKEFVNETDNGHWNPLSGCMNLTNGMNGHNNDDSSNMKKPTDIYYLDIFMEFNVFDANRLCKGVFKKRVNPGNTFDMQWYGTPETGYNKWLSLFVLHVGFINEYNGKIKCELEVDSKIQPTNHYFALLYEEVFPGVDSTVFLATPDKFSSVLTSVTQENMLPYDRINAIPIKLLAESKTFSYFRIPIITSRSFTLNDGKYYY